MPKKIRIYELARELNMTNKALLTKLKLFGVSVKSHVSTLDESVVTRVRDFILGKDSNDVSEKRVKASVIRRRKKETAPEQTEEPTIEPTIESEETETEVEAVEPVSEVVPDKKEIVEHPEKTKPNSSDKSEEVLPPVKKASRRKRKRRTRRDMPAKIIQLAPEPETKSENEKKSLKSPHDKKQDEKQKSKAPKKSVHKPSEKTTIIQDDESTSKKSQKKKDYKRKKTEEVNVKEDEKKVRRAKWAKKKISFKHKSVIEGADLYTSGKRNRKQRKAKAVPQKTQITIPKAIKRRIKIDDTIVLAELAKRMGVKANEMIGKLMIMGVMVTVNQTIDFDTAVLVASEFEFEVERAAFEEETILKTEVEDTGDLTARPPVVTIMGHVDHGKTSLLDVIRSTKVTESEAGGITQHVGAYSVETSNGTITFLDTPGHEAFTTMRSRGASVTDIVILVVAAEDGVMPQTIEAINHSKVAGVPIIVAINKIDKPDAEPDRVMRELSDHGLISEEWGGDTIFAKVSALQKIGINNLLELINLQSEMLELKANHNKTGKGYVVEAKLDVGRGPVATVLVQEGTLNNGDAIVCGCHHGKIRSLLDDNSAPVKSAGPSIPVQVLGLSGVPQPGDELIVLKDDRSAKQVSAHRMQKQRSTELSKTSRLSLDKLFEQMQQGNLKDLNLIIKTDVHGSIEALKESLMKLSNEEVKINIIHAATGAITESDVSLAAVSNAIILGFNVRPNANVQALAEEENVDMRFYSIIYKVIKEIQSAIVGMMDSTFEERITGRAEVREVFQVPKIGAIAGSYVIDGKIERGRSMRVLRDGVVMYEGRNSSLRRFKDDVKEVQIKYECGIGIEKYNDLKVGDVIECFYMEEIKPDL